MTTGAKQRKRPPWKKTNPKAKAGTSRRLSPQDKARARKAAEKAGRRYPNLVDNMRVSARKK
jgi:hypothetical protein